MSRKERVAALLVGSVILGAVAYLLLFAPVGSLGSIDGQSLEVDRFFGLGFIGLCLAGGYLLIRKR